MNYFIVGLGIVMVCLGLAAYIKVDKLEKKLKEKGILEEDWGRDEK